MKMLLQDFHFNLLENLKSDKEREQDKMPSCMVVSLNKNSRTFRISYLFRKKCSKFFYRMAAAIRQIVYKKSITSLKN